ncbi:hypothetical protein COY90_03675 [Candidatus Roizmanbacteria bacterium CG_4_10_14_0_8_um_filter_39_9]|uniref:Solute-binding protein family 5 domain-containing protein n=1 Tax=Candidatus Roizmanbacteria bacterium CG_4_10_14_0_8_um_filter_39_9 TaxID=1974829 RepID=A0A2M7QCB6_9BACT|nr:MAG: hypothetical protein COY90_03675 [Candidatus Roizmanbacteria bacterium CG_4_10_14_0_8_um_filter_39_9]
MHGSTNKTLRYYYWLTLEFFKKHLRLIFLSTFISTITIISAITVSPYLITFLSPRETVMGLVGTYNKNDPLPDEIAGKISNGLVFVNEKGRVLPVLASSWEILNEGLTYRFSLKKNLLFDNNTFFTAKDVDYIFKDIKMRVVGDYIVEFELPKPLAIFPIYLSKPIIKYPFIGVGGLYKVEHTKYKFSQLSEIQLNPNKKNLNTLVYKFYASESDLLSAYKRGEISQMHVSKKSIADTFKAWNNTIVEKMIDYSNLLTLFFNYRNPLLREKDVRGAIDATIDRPKFAELGAEAKSSIPPTSWAYNKDLKSTIFDLDYAQKMVKKYKTASDSAKLNFNTYYEYLDIATDINKNLNDVGLSTNLNVVSFSNTNDFDILLAYLKIPSDPDQYYYWHSTQSLSQATNYKNLKVDKLLEDGRSFASFEERTTYYRDLQKVMNDDNAALFLFYPYTFTIKRK